MRGGNWLGCLGVLGGLLWAGGDPAWARTWKDQSGKFSVEAELVAVKDGKVQLRKPTGETLQVPLERLSEADQEFVRQTVNQGIPQSGTTGDAGAATGAGPSGVAQLEKMARSLPTARAVAQLYRDYLAGNVEAAERTAATQRLQHWESLAAQQVVRLGGQQWLSRQEAEAQEAALQAGLAETQRLIESGNEDLVRTKLKDTSKAHPWSMEPDWRLGLLCAVAFRDAAGAEAAFESCLKKRAGESSQLRGAERANVAAAYNNLALAKVRLKEWSGALVAWRRAAELLPAMPELAHNLSRLSSLNKAHPDLKIPSDVLNSAAELYAKVAVTGNAPRPSGARGWLYVQFLPESTVAELLAADSQVQLAQPGEKPDTLSGAKTGGPSAKDNSDPTEIGVAPSGTSPQLIVLVGGGSGLVIAPGVVLTNRHVLEGGDMYRVVHPGTKKEHQAKRLAIADSDDLGLLSVIDFDTPPVPFTARTPRLATEVTILGFPAFTELGQDLKVSRGAISGLPNPQLENKLLYDAVTNQGNSGGPVCDQYGHVVAVHAAGIGTVLLRNINAGKLGAGIPASRALSFIHQHFPQVQPAPIDDDPPPPWADAVERVGKSTVNILLYKRASSVDFVRQMAQSNGGPGGVAPGGVAPGRGLPGGGLPGGSVAPGGLSGLPGVAGLPGMTGSGGGRSSNSSGATSLLEDRWCLHCYGTGRQPCPQRGCHRGVIKRQVVEALGPRNTRTRTVTDVCPTCRGKDALPCRRCVNGVDRSL